MAQAACPNGTVYLQMRDVLGSVYEDGHFADRFARRGRPAEAPWRLALVTVMHFAEGLTDRQAGEAVRARSDWTYALALAQDDPGFAFSVLSALRSRLVEGAAAYRLLEVLLERCRERARLSQRARTPASGLDPCAGWVPCGSLTASSVTASSGWRRRSLRAALNALAGEAPDWLRAQVAPDWYERYGRRIEEYHLPKGQDARHAYAAQIGSDGQYLLTCLAAPETPQTLSQLPAAAVVRAVWEQPCVVAADGQVQVRDPKALPPRWRSSSHPMSRRRALPPKVACIGWVTKCT